MKKLRITQHEGTENMTFSTLDVGMAAAVVVVCVYGGKMKRNKRKSQ